MDPHRDSPTPTRTTPHCEHCALPVPASRVRGARGAALFCCFGCRFAYEVARPAADADGAVRPAHLLLVRLGFGIFLTLNIMVFSWTFYSQEVFGVAARPAQAFDALTGLFAYLLMLLSTIVLVLLGLPLLTDALANSRVGRVPVGSPNGFEPVLHIDANLLIVIGVASAYALSVWHTLRGSGSLYFDTAAMILVLVTLGNYLEASAKRRATSATAALLEALPERVWLRRGARVFEAGLDSLRPGDTVRVRAGEVCAVDGVIQEGASQLDTSRFTGESRPRHAGPGDTVLAGTVSTDGELWVAARRTARDSALWDMQRLLERARMDQPGLQRIADRVAAAFVPCVVLLALALFAWHTWDGRLSRGLFTGLSVLLISCPCALGLAAPLATWTALHRAARRGIVFDSAESLERAARVTRVLFDKTGTLTDPRLRVERVVPAAEMRLDRALSLAASLESASLHPIARCLVEHARAAGAQPRLVREFRALPGLGVQGVLDGVVYRLGGLPLLERSGIEPSTLAARPGDHAVFLVDQQRVLARFDLIEVPRRDAAAAIEVLRGMGIRLGALTGDGPGPAHQIGQRLNLEVEHSLLPADKVRRLRETRAATPGRVAMVGDGINDAPVLAAADIGIAMASATDLAKHAGNVRLLADRLSGVPLALSIGRHCARRIRLNLAWAFGYNTIGIGLAAVGLLNPVFAGTSMILSSLIVVALARGAGNVALPAAVGEVSSADIDSVGSASEAGVHG